MKLPDSLKINQYQLTLRPQQPLKLPAFKGSALRGGFGHALKALACRQKEGCEQKCQQGNSCAHGYIFETSPPPMATALRNFENIPRPYVIRPPLDDRTVIPAGELLSFQLILIGQAISYHPYFEETFRQLGEKRGLGQSYARYRLLKMELMSQVTAEHVAAYTTLLPPKRLTLRLITPTRLKQGGQWVRTGPPFAVLVRTLLSRLSSLSQFHCGEALDLDFRGLIDRAEAVNVVKNEATWQEWSRFSGRQKQRIALGGLVGRVTYTGDLASYLPLLAVGELIHLGKGTVFGNGQYRIEGDQANG